jgi:hypothetical protein
MTNKKCNTHMLHKTKVPVPAARVYLNVSYGNKIGGNGMDSSDDTFRVCLVSFANTILYVAQQQVSICAHIKCTTALLEGKLHLS